MNHSFERRSWRRVGPKGVAQTSELLDEIAPSERRWWLCLPPIVPFLILFLTSYIGRDYGSHYDEPRLIYNTELSYQSGILLPVGFYSYPSVSYWISMVSAIPNSHAIRRLPKDFKEAATPQSEEQVENDAQIQSFRLRARAMFAFFSALGVFWVYLAVWRWRRDLLAASLASATFGLSWAFAYHARWMAPDAVMAQFAALALWCCFEIRTPNSRSAWAYTGAAAVGVCASTKYPGALMLLPLGIAIFQRGMDPDTKRLVPLLLVTFALTYLAITPGTLLEPFDFINNVLYEARHYHTGHYGHTIAPGLPHLIAIFQFLALALASHLPLNSLAVFGVALSTGVWLMVRKKADAWLLLTFPLLYVVYMASQHVFFVRNLLVLAPFIACLFGIGIAEINRQIPRIGQAAFLTMVGFLTLINAIWLVQAALSIRDRSGEETRAEFMSFLHDHPNDRIWLSPKVKTFVASTNFPSAARGITEADFIATYPSEPFLHRVDWPALDWNLIVRQFGSSEIDFNYYPSWKNEDRIVLMRKSKAEARLPAAFLAGSSDRSLYLPSTPSIPPPPP